MNYCKNNNEKFTELKKSIINLENNINELINKMEKQIKKAAELIKLSDIFDAYKSELIKNIDNITEYKEHPDIFKEEKINNFILSNLYEFIENNLGNHSFSIIKRDITNYNLYIEILTNFNEFKNKYAKNVDVEI